MKPPNQSSLINMLMFLGLALCVTGCSRQQESGSSDGQGALAQEEQEFERGPHNGRLLRDGPFALEITIFETGVPPEFRVYPYLSDQPINPNSVELAIELGRLGDHVDRFVFRPQGDFLRGDGVVLEPHSFEVIVTAQSGGGRFRWQYESYEGRTEIEPTVAQAMGIEVAQATSGKIRELVRLQGSITYDPDAVTEVLGRFPGIVQSLHKTVGDAVRRGDALADVQSNESLQTYVVTAPRAGIVIARDAKVGSTSSNGPLYVIADLSQMVAELTVYERDLNRAVKGQSVNVSSLDGTNSTTGTIERILPLLDTTSRAATARIAFEANGSKWRPGQFVQGVVVVAEHDIDLVVRQSGLQSFRDFTVVYARVGDTYEVRMLELGRRDGEYVEVLGGLEPGATYVTENSYLVKADIEKSGASHDH
jgi:cobalt-zinc-cadmium efflux system membrane fusion protein